MHFFITLYAHFLEELKTVTFQGFVIVAHKSH